MTADDYRALAEDADRDALRASSLVQSRAHRRQAREYRLAALMAEYRLDSSR